MNRTSVRLKDEVELALKAWVSRSGLTASHIINEALRVFLENAEREGSIRLGSVDKPTFNDYKTKERKVID